MLIFLVRTALGRGSIWSCSTTLPPCQIASGTSRGDEAGAHAHVEAEAGGDCRDLVHHSNKSEDNSRGSTAIAATFEVILGLKRAEDLALTGGTRPGS
jgi:hypothetical protein